VVLATSVHFVLTAIALRPLRALEAVVERVRHGDLVRAPFRRRSPMVTLGASRRC
jgi:hypothetical protein